MEAALGFRAHSGWAAMVALTGPADAPMLIQRGRVELADRGKSGSVQPCHAAREIELEDAEPFLASCAGDVKKLATAAIR